MRYKSTFDVFCIYYIGVNISYMSVVFESLFPSEIKMFIVDHKVSYTNIQRILFLKHPDHKNN